MKFLFEVTEEKINNMPVEDYETLEMAQDGDVKIYRLRRVLCRFLVDENNVEIPHDTALKMTSKLKMPEMQSFVEQFMETMKAKAVPKATGSPSSSPLLVSSVDSLSQTG